MIRGVSDDSDQPNALDMARYASLFCKDHRSGEAVLVTRVSFAGLDLDPPII